MGVGYDRRTTALVVACGWKGVCVCGGGGGGGVDEGDHHPPTIDL